MIVIKEFGEEDVAKVYVGKFNGENKIVEFAESFQQDMPLEKKWVIIISTSFGCPVKCLMCDAGSNYFGQLSANEMIEQVDYVVSKRFPNRKVPSEKFKVQFTRMGEPAFNMNVLSALHSLPAYFDAPGLMPSVSSVGPVGCDAFFERLIDVKNEHFGKGKFQMQFSIHTTDEKKRDEIIPIRKINFREIAEYGEKFFREGDRKITLNFAAMQTYPIEPETIYKYFDPKKFIVKLTPLNPTGKVRQNNLKSVIDPYAETEYNSYTDGIIQKLQQMGFDVILSIGELKENEIGSNCGQFVTQLAETKN